MSATAHNVEFVFEAARSVPLSDGSVLSFAPGERLRGALSIEPCDGPEGSGTRENLALYRVSFSFEHGAKKLTYEGDITPADLFVRCGEKVSESYPIFSASTGQIKWVFDSREDITYQLHDGSNRTFTVKLVHVNFDVMVEAYGLLVRCEYFDEANFQKMIPVFYKREWAHLLFHAPTIAKDGELAFHAGQGARVTTE